MGSVALAGREHAWDTREAVREGQERNPWNRLSSAPPLEVDPEEATGWLGFLRSDAWCKPA